MLLRIYQIDAFASSVFSGNPAAVVPLDVWLDDATLLSIAAENNLSETAFFVPGGDCYHLRWFTPAQEVNLCGHATLATAYVILHMLHPDDEVVRFETLSGMLSVEKNGDRLTLDFPRRNPKPGVPPPLLLDALKIQPHEILEAENDKNLYVVFEHEDHIRLLQPDMSLLMQLYPQCVAATAPGSDVDFVSRYFAPGYGIPEDPVTGSAHCGLAPYWANRLGKTTLLARQISHRGGELHCEVRDDRVMISGTAIKYMEGTIEI